MDRKALIDKVKELYYRANIAAIDVGGKLCPALYPQPKYMVGNGSALKTPAVLREVGITHPMVVCGHTVGRTIVPPILEELKKNGIRYELFGDVEVNPSIETAEAIYKQYVSAGCDGFLAIGGGSSMDAAKAAAARKARPNTPLTAMAGLMKVLVPAPPIVAIPTTAGTGSECSFVTVITDHKNEKKIAVTDQHLLPKYAILDPTLTLSVPQGLTAANGMDALTHAIESYISRAWYTPETMRNCEEAVVKIFRYMEKAYADGSDLEARSNMLVASFKAGLAFTHTGVGNIHAISHALGGKYGVSHGLANSVILPIVLEDYGKAVWPQLAHLAEIAGVKTDGSEEEKARAFIREIRAMNRRMGLPTGLDCIRQEDYAHIIKTALHEANNTYPVPVIYNEARCRHVLNRIVTEA